MLEPYRMVFVNIISFALILLGTVIWKRLYPRKKIYPFILLMLFTCLPLISVLRAGVYESGDFNLHIYRTMAFFDSLKSGVFMPSWGGDLNGKFGYPLFIFLNPVPYYVISFFHFLGFSFVASMKLFLIICTFLSSIGMYVWTKKVFKNSIVALVSSTFYVFAPYHLVDLHFRVALGEITIFALLPFVLLSLEKLFEEKTLKNSIVAGLLIGIFILSHQAVAGFCLLFLTVFFFFRESQKKNLSLLSLRSYIVSYLLGSLIALYSITPYIFLQKFTNGVGAQPVSSVSLQELLFSPWRMGFLFQGPNGELSYIIGYIQLVVVVIAVVLLIKKQLSKDNKSVLVFLLAAFFTFILLMLPITQFIWYSIPFIRIMALSTRLLLPLSLVVSLIAGFVAKTLPKKKYILYGIIVLAILSTILNWGNRRVIPEITDTTLKIQQPLSTKNGEGWAWGIPKWRITNGYQWESKEAKTPLQILSGNGKIKLLSHAPERHSYIVYISNPATLLENTLYFPNWVLVDNGKITPINYSSKKYPGIISFALSNGLHMVELRYIDPLILQWSKLVSVITFGGCILFWIVLSFYRRK